MRIVCRQDYYTYYLPKALTIQVAINFDDAH